jgi:hypothetical protein
LAYLLCKALRGASEQGASGSRPFASVALVPHHAKKERTNAMKTTFKSLCSIAAALWLAANASAQTTAQTLAVLYSFQSDGYNQSGSAPFAGLLLSGSTLYGTTFLGGGANQGTVFYASTNGGGDDIAQFGYWCRPCHLLCLGNIPASSSSSISAFAFPESTSLIYSLLDLLMTLASRSFLKNTLTSSC